jgi:hypothetical protein
LGCAVGFGLMATSFEGDGEGAAEGAAPGGATVTSDIRYYP